MRSFYHRNNHHDFPTGQLCRVIPALLTAVASLLAEPLAAQLPDSKSVGTPPAAVSAGRSEATELIRRAHAQLVQKQSFRAEIQETVALSQPPFELKGDYVAVGLKMRLRYTTELPGGAKGALLEVCDGERLWSMMELPGATRITRRDIRQILTAVQQNPVKPEHAAVADLALGGIPALLTSLERSMQFESIKPETVDGKNYRVVLGRWRPELAEKLGGSSRDPKFPDHIPELVRIYLAEDTLFPDRIAYLKKHPEKKGYRVLVDLRFVNVVMDAPVEPSTFEFTPPDNIEPEDITRKYLDQLFPQADKAAK